MSEQVYDLGGQLPAGTTTLRNTTVEPIRVKRPARRERLAFGTRDLAVLRDNIDAPDSILRAVAIGLEREFLTVRGRVWRLRNERARSAR